MENSSFARFASIYRLETANLTAQFYKAIDLLRQVNENCNSVAHFPVTCCAK